MMHGILLAVVETMGKGMAAPCKYCVVVAVVVSTIFLLPQEADAQQ